MKPFLSFQGSRACFFSDLFTGESCPLRIPFDRPLGHELEAEWLRAAVSPIPKSRKQRRPPASLSRNDFMALPAGKIPQDTALPALGERSEHYTWALSVSKEDIHVPPDNFVTEPKQ
jgi:hypothetical protein